MMRALVMAVAVGMLWGCEAHQPAGVPKGQTTVVWISVDGMRGDYLEQVRGGFLGRLMREGASTEHLRPGFPSLTFPSHVMEATGAGVDKNGIPGNNFIDAPTAKLWEFPPDQSMLLAEPLWTAATREGVRTAVYDWPLSQMQKGPNAAAYFNERAYDKTLTDEQRLARLTAAYEGDAAPAGQPLRLLMGYVEATDPPGHKYGPDSTEVAGVLQQTDALLGRTFDRLHADFQTRRHPGDVFYFLVTTDHGMAQITTGVNLALALAVTPGGDVQVATSGPIGNLYISRKLSAAERSQRIDALLATLRAKPYADKMLVYRRSDLPAHWHYDQPDRVGDVVVVLKVGLVFQADQKTEIGPLPNLPHGTHGYPVEWDPHMEGGMVAWRSDHDWGGKQLGPIDTVNLAGTVAGWLGIERPAGMAGGVAGMR